MSSAAAAANEQADWSMSWSADGEGLEGLEGLEVLAGGRERARACLPCRQLKKKCEAERPCRSCVARRCPDECVDSGKNSACYQCRSRRLRCDRQRPCSRCVQRGAPEACSVVPSLELARAQYSGHQGAGKRAKTKTEGSLPDDGSSPSSGKRRKPAAGSPDLGQGPPQSTAPAVVQAHAADGLSWQVVPSVQRPLPFRPQSHRFDIPVQVKLWENSSAPYSAFLKRFYEVGFDVKEMMGLLSNLPVSITQDLTAACHTLEMMTVRQSRAIQAREDQLEAPGTVIDATYHLDPNPTPQP